MSYCYSRRRPRVYTFRKDWEGEFCFVEYGRSAVCLLCGVSVTLKRYNVSRHYQSVHKRFAEEYPVGSDGRAAQVQLLIEKFWSQPFVGDLVRDSGHSALGPLVHLVGETETGEEKPGSWLTEEEHRALSQAFAEEVDKYCSSLPPEHINRSFSSAQIDEAVKHMLECSSGTREKDSRFASLNRRYEVATIGSTNCLVKKRKSEEDSKAMVLPMEDYFDVLLEYHITTGHGGREKMTKAMDQMYWVPKCFIDIFVELCPVCKSTKPTSQKRYRPDSYPGLDEVKCEPLSPTGSSAEEPSNISLAEETRKAKQPASEEELEKTGSSIALKLARMDDTQAILAESIISQVLKRGLLGNLSYQTALCDNNCTNLNP